MSVIPEDILKATDDVIERGYDEGLHETIARAILAERKRCAEVARHLNGWGYPPAPALADHIANIIEAGK